MKHMAGNMLSRWTDFLTTDGEKPERNRDMEFIMLARALRLSCGTDRLPGKAFQVERLAKLERAEK